MTAQRPADRSYRLPGDGANRRRLLGLLAAPAIMGTFVGRAPAGAEDAARAERTRKRSKNRNRCPANRVKIDGRCAPPRNAACEASPICTPFNVADDQTGDAAACMHNAGSDLCNVAYVCRTNTDCPADELCSKVLCSDGFNRCQRMCNDPAVVAASA